MIHIGSHYEQLTPREQVRPNFWVIEHMWRYKLISPEDYSYVIESMEKANRLISLNYFSETPETRLEKSETRRSTMIYASYTSRNGRGERKQRSRRTLTKLLIFTGYEILIKYAA